MSSFPIAGPIWLVGAGNMGGAMLRRWLQCGLDPAQVTIIRKSGAPFAEGVTVLTAPPPDGSAPALVMLGVKPQMIDDVAPWLAPVLAPETLFVSILAGVEIATLRSRFQVPRAVLRAMPNTPVALGQGVTGLAGDGLDADEQAAATALMGLLGLVEWTDEPALDVVAALAGSGPAFLFRFIDALAEAGADAGLPAEQAARMALATVAGASALAAGSDESPRRLAERVTSKGGSTRRGLDVLDEPEGLAALMRDTLTAAILRNREMAAEARG
ncbi:pyrroline-5-carboxylate reductase [Sphingomonas nostoxanthinifaciens]|uniref:pyrroline-5-carboxylate reductase n=1 Tax=Sphingomonas nostoxanthinifaciens TaxID=2872652 RepID=UPI001CC2160C|nr:pyrroline-5-carboxylate reductase [Sphingomonas nostoxanthinifaciens]UAK26108.1 pyrroline-5-carboxylate reductase [Sphingomonas nostoxanthinifaciens]